MKKFLLISAAAFLVLGLAAAETYQQAYKTMSTLRNQRKYKEAAAAAKRAEKLAKTDNQKAQAVFMTGIIECQMRQYAAGIANLEKAAALFKNPASSISSQYHAGYFLAVCKKYPEAIAAMEKTIAYGKKGNNINVERAKALITRYLFNQKKYKEAVAHAKKVLPELKAGNPLIICYSALFDAASALKDKKTTGEVIEKMLAIKTVPGYDQFTVYRYGANYYRSVKQYEKSIACSQKILENKKVNRHSRLHGHYYKALALTAMGKKKEALEQWKILQKGGDKHFAAMADRRLAPGKK